MPSQPPEPARQVASRAPPATARRTFPRQTFPRTLRVIRKRDFQRAWKGGGRARGSILVVVAVENGRATPRLGLSVGKSIWKGAVQRNRVRRIFREAFRLEQHELPAGFDLILIPARPKLEPELAATRAELVKLAAAASERARAQASRRTTP
jgi:ribonuclease P protein component